MQYNFKQIEKKWQLFWHKNQTFKASENTALPKYYVLDMFPYPSGAGLHVGHPLGYIASDIYARYKRQKGFNVLHPQGYDSFGLPAEQYAIQTGQHPAKTTKANISTYRRQLDQLGFSYDWSREVRTSEPEYYKWTQWIFIQLFDSWYDKDFDRAAPISSLIALFEKEGNTKVNAHCDQDVSPFTAHQWKALSKKAQEAILLKYRLTFLSDTEVNWCPALGTVLANDEIVNGLSERGGHPVVRKKMTQWSMRISAYAQRLLDGLDSIDWPKPLKDAQTNWIGRSQGAMVSFKVNDHDECIEVFTTRPDTIFGVSFMTLAPEHGLVSKITTDAQKAEVSAYLEATAKRSERDRMADVKTITGVFTGSYAIHPFTGKKLPIWIGDYVLVNYGTGAVMSVPCGDQRDYDFAKRFGIQIPSIFKNVDLSESAHSSKEGTLISNSDFLTGLTHKEALKTSICELEKRAVGFGKVNYRLRDAVFSRQRYWGEPFPVYYKDEMPQMIDVAHLPIVLPEVSQYQPTKEGKPPLGSAEAWAWDTLTNSVTENSKVDHKTIFPLELNTMPGWAGSSWYFNRYTDPCNKTEFASKEFLNYWKQVDLYMGGSEHATGHLLYARFWQKFLFDRGWVPVDEFAKKLINQGMILGESAFVYKMTAFYRGYDPVLGETHDAISGWTKLISKNKLRNQTDEFFSDQEYESKFFCDLKTLCNTNSLLNLKSLFGTDNEVFKLAQEAPTLELIDFLRGKIFFSIQRVRVDVSLISSSDELNVVGFKADKKYLEFKDAEFICEVDGSFKVSREVEKMSKSKFNVVNPDKICETYGADSLRLFEMFLGPLEQTKPWKTSGISGVHSFLKKLWNLFYRGERFDISETAATPEELKILHSTIKKVSQDIENFSFNTSVSTFMIAVNQLTTLKCNKRLILEPLLILISPYAPHITEELWNQLGHKTSISLASFPIFDPKHLVENSKKYPISFNGKMRFVFELPLGMSKETIEKKVMAHKKTQIQLQGRRPKKIIVVPEKIVNIVV